MPSNRRSRRHNSAASHSAPPYADYDTPAVLEDANASDQQRGHEFIRLFNEIDHYVKRLVGSNGGEGFFRRLQWAVRDNPAIKRYVDDLMEYAELRNAMVHDRHFPNEMIAVPTEKMLRSFRLLVERIVRPRRVMPQFGCDLRVFGPEEPLSAALNYMHRQGYTQVVAREGAALRLLTAAGVTRWLTAQLASPPVAGGGEIAAAAVSIDLAKATVADVLVLEKPEVLALIPRDATLEEAVDVFQQAVSSRRGRLFALVITEHGQAEEAPLGIITPADLLDEE